MIADAFVSFVAIVVLVVIFYSVWQDLCVEYARQIMFEQRDKLFDFAFKERLEFTSPEYRAIRSSLNSMIRFAHNMTVTNFIFMLVFDNVLGSEQKETNLYRAINAIEDCELKNDIEKLVVKATIAVMTMMISRSLLCVSIGIISTPVIILFSIIVRCVKAFRAQLRPLVNRLGNIIQHEVEYATD